MSQATPYVIILGCGVILSSVVVPVAISLATRRHLPWTISRRLLNGSGPIKMRTGWTSAAWNPAKHTPGRRFSLTPMEPGLAIYTLGDENQIVLDWVPDRGEPQRYIGAPMEAPSDIKQFGLVAVAVMFAYAVAGALGFLLTYVLTDQTGSARLRQSLMFGLVCWAGAWAFVSFGGGRRVVRVLSRARRD
jgi:hypothetical protein